MGGIGGGGVLDTVEVYDPQADSWQRVASMPRGLRSHAAAAMGGKIYVTGGVTGLGAPPVNSVYVYDPQADAWTQLASLGTARRFHASAVVGGKLYVFGGFAGFEHLSTAEVYDPASDSSWAQVTSLASARMGIAAAAL
jgi:N-acetylneuraminic acid mutarotase